MYATLRLILRCMWNAASWLQLHTTSTAFFKLDMWHLKHPVVGYLLAGVHSGVGGEEEGQLFLLQRGGQERAEPHAHEHIRRQ